jgi:alpha-N-arabinofuranosidase
MGEIDTQHQVKLIVDEWGAWHQTADVAPGYLFGYFPTLRDALVSGITLDIFNRHADKVAMANAAQLVNNIHTSFLAAGDKFTVTPIFHVFEMYAPHQGGTSVRTEMLAPRIKAEAAHGLALSGSCSLHSRHAVLTVVNPDDQNAQETEITARGARLTPVSSTVLTSKDIHGHNDFERPNALEPVTEKISGGGPSFMHSFPPASVTRLEFDLG